MKSTSIRIGDKIELIHVKSATNRALSTNKYGSKLLDYDGFYEAKIAIPIFEGRIVPLEVGDEYLLCFFTLNGLYQCEAQIKKRTVENNVYVIMVEFVSKPKKYQRRGFYRLACLFPIRERSVSDEEHVLMEQLAKNEFSNEQEKANCKEQLKEILPEWKEAFVSDISGGGVRFHSHEERTPGEVIELFIPLVFKDEVVPIKASMKVISCIRSVSGKIPYETRGEFVDMEGINRELIIKYVFEEQRKRLRKD